jgi:hypothetical protein
LGFWISLISRCQALIVRIAESISTVSRPVEGKVIEPSVPGDICEVMLMQACKELEKAGEVPRVLQLNIHDNFDGLGDLAMKFGITWMIRGDFSDGEWCVHNLKEGDEKVSYWNKPY